MEATLTVCWYVFNTNVCYWCGIWFSIVMLCSCYVECFKAL